MNKRKIIFLVLAIIWMGVIFVFSSRNADESTKDSYKVGLKVGEITVPNFEEKTYEEQISFAKKIDHPVRKTAHATEYAILMILFIGVFSVKKMHIGFICTVVYAIIDEVHQLFVPGRSGMITDVLIDSSGALFICAIIILFQIIKNKGKL